MKTQSPSRGTSDILIRLQQVGFRYRGAKAPILRGVDLTVRRGDRILFRGRSGSGKSTLLWILAGLIPEYVAGELTGQREFFYRRGGVVLQNPEAQVVTPTVEEEVAFALENQGKDPAWIRSRVKETLEALGIAQLSGRHPLSLSGGECQRVSLAAALAMEPDILFLDEPTSYLDEESSQRFFQALELLHPETALVVVEHRLEAASRICQKAYRVEPDGSIVESDFTPDRVEIPHSDSLLLSCSTDPSPIGQGKTGHPDSHPLWRNGQRMLLSHTGTLGSNGQGSVLWVQGLSHRWPEEKKCRQETREQDRDNYLFRDIHLKVNAGDIVALLGASGAGKTTLLGKISGRLPVEKGTVFIEGKDISTLSKEDFYSLFMLVPQNPEHMFLAETVGEELSTVPEKAEWVAERFGLAHRLHAHPFRLSEGEKRRLNLAIACSIHRPLYLLDEPTYGLDDWAKALLQKDLRTLAEGGSAVLFVTHDRAFAEATARTVYTLKEGQLVREVRHEPVYCPA